MFFHWKLVSVLFVLGFFLIPLIEIDGKPMLSPDQDVETVESSLMDNVCPNLHFGCDNGFCWTRCVVESSTSRFGRIISNSSYSEFRMSTDCDEDQQCQTWAMGGSYRRYEW